MATKYKIIEIENGVESCSYTFNNIDGVAYYGYSKSKKVKCEKDAKILLGYQLAKNGIQQLKNKLEMFELEISKLENEYLKHLEN